MLLLGDASSNRLHQVECPENYVGVQYENAVLDLIHAGQLMVGILRMPRPRGLAHSEDVLRDGKMPFVITNPAPKTVVLRKTDFLFIVGCWEAHSTSLGTLGTLGDHIFEDPTESQNVASSVCSTSRRVPQETHPSPVKAPSPSDPLSCFAVLNAACR